MLRRICLSLSLLLALPLSACARAPLAPPPPPPLALEGRLVTLTSEALTLELSGGQRCVFSLTEQTTVSGEPVAGRRVRVSGEGALTSETPEQDAALFSVTVDPPTLAERAQELLAPLTLEQRVGQMFIARAPADEPSGQYQPGGYILFAADFDGQTPATLRTRLDRLAQNAPLPLLVGVDEEGGTVCRVSRFSAFRATPFRSPQQLYRQGGLELIAQDAREKAALLSSLGINLNFAPVCDLSENPRDFIYNRTLGRGVEETSRFVETVVKASAEYNIGSVLKHFPGYGDNADTHTGGALDRRPAETFYTRDLLPFAAGIKAGAEVVLVSHNTVTAFDEALPASLSPAVHRLLREELEFEGVIVTDDLIMQAVTSVAGTEQAAVLAVEAGNDLLCVSAFDAQCDAVLAAVREGRIPPERIDQSAARVIALKLSLGLLE